MAKKAPAKSSAKSPARKLIPQPHGGALMSGGGGHRGGTGRPRDEWKAKLAELVSADAILEHVRDVLADPGHPQWFNALRWASEHGYGKPEQAIQVSGADGGPIQYGVVILPLLTDAPS